jgi:hypothetical protein
MWNVLNDNIISTNDRNNVMPWIIGVYISINILITNNPVDITVKNIVKKLITFLFSIRYFTSVQG